MTEANSQLPTSEQPHQADWKPSLYKKMIAVMKEVGQLEKDGVIKDKNGKVMYTYLSEEAITSAIQRAYIAHGLIVLPVKITDTAFAIDSYNRYEKITTPVNLTKVNIVYKIIDAETGEWEYLEGFGYGNDDGDKAANKAQTNAYKYMQRQTYSISTGINEDPDATPTGGDHQPQSGKVQGNELADKAIQQKARKIWGELSDPAGFDEYWTNKISSGATATWVLEVLEKKKETTKATAAKQPKVKDF